LIDLQYVGVANNIILSNIINTFILNTIMTKLEFIEIKNKFLNHLKNSQKSMHTQKSYLLDLEQILNLWNTYEERDQDTQNNIDLEQILLIYLESLNSSNISSSSIARKISCINSFKKFLLSMDITINIKPKRPVVILKDPLTLDPEDISIILDLVDTKNFHTKSPYRDKAIMQLLYTTGILCSEITQIEINHIDFKSNTIIVRSKNKRERIVTFSNKASKYISLYIDSERVKIKNNTEKLFLNKNNTPLGIRSIQRICQMFKVYLADNKLLTPNILRNSFASHMLKNGANINKMQELLGHKTKISTIRYISKKSDL